MSVRRSVWGILAILFFVTPLVVMAQDGRRGDRGEIQVTNDWNNTVRVTLWKERGEQMTRRSWTIPTGQSTLLGDEGGRSIRVRSHDKIKVGEDWGRVEIGAVGQLQNGVWLVSVRDIWRATHERRSRPGLPPDSAGTALPPDQSSGVSTRPRR
jgi:hypothetical protein